jgi:hypothetical protein
MTALMATTGFLATGCECQDQGTNEQGQNVTTCESVKKFVGTSYSESVAYTAGQGLTFNGVNGNVDVNIGGTEVVVEFTPFSVRGHSKQAEAADDMEQDLQTSLTNDGDIVVEVDRADGSFNGLGADVVITLPSSFDGAVTINQNNGFVDLDLEGALPTSVTVDNDGSGDIDIAGARGALNIKGAFDIDVRVDEWAPEGSNGSIISDGSLGDITVSLPTASAGSIEALSETGIVTGPSPLPENWVEEAAAEGSKTFSFGVADATEPGAIVQVQAGENISVEAR